jgi:signal transduction histidine kinase
MGRRAKPAKVKAESKRPRARKSPKDEGSGVRDLEKRLAEALKDKAEAQEQQTATAEILRVISSTPTDTQPVFDAIVNSTQRLMAGKSTVLLLRRDPQFVVRAYAGPAIADLPDQVRVAPLDREQNFPSRAILDAEIVHVPDWEADDVPEHERVVGRSFGIRAGLMVPLLREGQGIGALVVTRSTAGPYDENEIALLRSFADQAVIAIENVRLFTELQTSNRELTAALDKQTATSDILRVISGSQMDVRPVFETIAANAARLCGAVWGAVHRFDGELIHLAAYHNMGADELAAAVRIFPVPLGRGTVTGRAISSRAIVHVEDVTKDPEQTTSPLDRAGFRTILSVPMLREGLPIGTINVGRLEVKPFSADQIALLQTFADQAVIAIENVRLFKELESSNSELRVALEQQTATSEILGVISSSPADVQPVFDTIAASATRLCDALYSLVFRFDGDTITLVAADGSSPERLEVIRSAYPAPAGRTSVAAQAILERRVIAIADAQSGTEYPHIAARAQAIGYRSIVSVPMLRGEAAIGAINVVRVEAIPFTETQIELLETFADQAVIAIENVRLFNETKEALEQQTATAEILTVISSSPTEVQPVFATIAARAKRLCDARECAVFRFDGDLIHLVALADTSATWANALRSAFPRPPGRGSLTARAILTRSIVHIPDVLTDPEYELTEAARASNIRSVLVVPMIREGEVVGAITVDRYEPKPFLDKQIALVKIFADQAVIAIENVRLFHEIEDKSRQLEAASQHKSEFLANMSHELRTPLNAIIGFSEVLTERMFGELNEKQDEYLKDIYASGQHLLSLINDILDLSKIEAGRMELEPTDFDLPSAIDNAMTLVRERAGRRGIALGRTIDERVGTIRGDERKVKQVLLNLLSNALKFTPEGGRIDVRAALSGGMVEVSVADTGVGIAPEDLETVFEEFRQVGTADKKVEGTGLGLALSRKFIELHGGRIWVKSQVGQGSTFTFTLPVGRSE